MKKVFNEHTQSREELRGQFRGMMTASLVLAIGTGTGCPKASSNPVSVVHVENVSALTSQNANNDELIDFSITLSTQNFLVAAVTLPIVDPRNATREYGSLSIAPVFCSTPANCPYGNGVDITVNLDMTQILQTQGVAPLLPNGSALPVGGLQNSSVIALPIANTGAMIYFAYGKGVAMLGTAVPFTQLDVVGKTIPGANLFIPVTVSTAKGPFTLLPGIFTGQASNSTGIGFFADLSGIIPQSTLFAAANSKAVELYKSDLIHGKNPTPIKSNLIFESVYPSSASKRNKLYKALSNLESHQTRLNLK